MKRKLYFYLTVSCLTILNALLLASPNLLGKLGLLIYHYRFLRTFPRTLLTVSIAVALAVIMAEFIGLLVKNEMIKRSVGVIILVLLIALCGMALLKTVSDFSTWAYSHTGQRFRYGAYLLPCLLIFIFGYRMFTLPVWVETEVPIDNKPL